MTFADLRQEHRSCKRLREAFAPSVGCCWVAGGADAAHFVINGTSGVLTFVSAPDFESPQDAGADNIYDVVVQITEDDGATDTQAIAVTVTAANES